MLLRSLGRTARVARPQRLLAHRVARPAAQLVPGRRWLSAEPEHEEEAPELSPEVAAIVDSIVKLNLEQVTELVNGLNKRLNLPDAPAMPMGMVGMPAGVPAAAEAPAAAAEKEEELKPIVDVQLDSFDAASKIKLIKEVKEISGLGLKEAKAAVEGAPGVLVKEMKREEAEAIVARLEALGGKASLV